MLEQDLMSMGMINDISQFSCRFLNQRIVIRFTTLNIFLRAG